MITSLERVQRALRHEETDRAPRLLYGEALSYVPTINTLLCERCAPRLPREYFEMDITSVKFSPTRLARSRFAEWTGAGFAEANASGQIDEWGVWRKSGSFLHFSHIESPLKDEEDMDRMREYPLPDIDQSYRYEGMAEKVAALHAQGLAVCGFAGSIFEQAWYVRGMETLMMDMLTEPEIAHYFLTNAARMQRHAAIEMAKAGVDIVITGDDVSGQEGLLMSRELWAEFLKPLLTETCRAVHQTAPEAKVFYHSDGNIVPLIPGLIECGIDILNPLQPECLDPAAVKAEFGDRLSFWGAVSVQRTMSFGTPDEVRNEVRERIRTVGKGGGYILAPAHLLGPETPWENIVAFFEAANEPV